MEKYGTYNIFQNTVTNEIKRIPIGSNEEELVKLANDSDWKQLEKDPEGDLNDR